VFNPVISYDLFPGGAWAPTVVFLSVMLVDSYKCLLNVGVSKGDIEDSEGLQPRQNLFHTQILLNNLQ